MKKPTPLKWRCHTLPVLKYILVSVVAASAATACTYVSPAVPANQHCPQELVQSASTPVVVATATSAEPAPSLPVELLSSLRTRAQAGKPTCLAVVDPQGNLIPLDITPRRSNGQVENGPTRAQKVETNIEAAKEAVAGLAATENEHSLLDRINDAVWAHRSPTTLYAISSGLDTRGPTDLNRIGWDADGKRVAQDIADAHALPDLGGWKVHFIGLGEVSGRQPQPGNAQRERLSAMWTAICRAQNAQCDVDAQRQGRTPPSSTNHVAVVPLPEPVTTTTSFTVEASFAFGINDWDLTTEAKAELRTFMQTQGRRCTGAVVTGNTDVLTGGTSFNHRLSLKRAQSFKSALASLGLDPPRIQVHGAGSANADAAREKADPNQVGRDRNVRIKVQPCEGESR